MPPWCADHCWITGRSEDQAYAAIQPSWGFLDITSFFTSIDQQRLFWLLRSQPELRTELRRFFRRLGCHEGISEGYCAPVPPSPLPFPLSPPSPFSPTLGQPLPSRHRSSLGWQLGPLRRQHRLLRSPPLRRRVANDQPVSNFAAQLHQPSS